MKSHTGFCFVPIPITLNDLERCNSPYFAFFTEFDSFAGRLSHCLRQTYNISKILSLSSSLPLSAKTNVSCSAVSYIGGDRGDPPPLSRKFSKRCLWILREFFSTFKSQHWNIRVFSVNKLFYPGGMTLIRPAPPTRSRLLCAIASLLFHCFHWAIFCLRLPVSRHLQGVNVDFQDAKTQITNVICVLKTTRVDFAHFDSIFRISV